MSRIGNECSVLFYFVSEGGGGSAPPRPPLSRPGGLRDSRIYSIRYNRYIKCIFETFHQIQQVFYMGAGPSGDPDPAVDPGLVVDLGTAGTHVHPPKYNWSGAKVAGTHAYVNHQPLRGFLHHRRQTGRTSARQRMAVPGLCLLKGKRANGHFC